MEAEVKHSQGKRPRTEKGAVADLQGAAHVGHTLGEAHVVKGLVCGEHSSVEAGVWRQGHGERHAAGRSTQHLHAAVPGCLSRLGCRAVVAQGARSKPAAWGSCPLPIHPP